jgi:hypothetical protein
MSDTRIDWRLDLLAMRAIEPTTLPSINHNLLRPQAPMANLELRISWTTGVIVTFLSSLSEPGRRDKALSISCGEQLACSHFQAGTASPRRHPNWSVSARVRHPRRIGFLSAVGLFPETKPDLRRSQSQTAGLGTERR